MCARNNFAPFKSKRKKQKKLTLEKVIETLEEVYPDDDDDYEYYYEDANGKMIVISKEECPKEEKGKRGYTPQDIIRTLESYKCRGRLVDIHQQTFLTTDYALNYDLGNAPWALTPRGGV